MHPVSCQQVVAPYYNADEPIVEVALRDADGELEILETTPNHPFFAADRGWTRADELAAGDIVRSVDGTVLTVEWSYWTERVDTVYNFGVEGFDTYVVGWKQAWVHNCKWHKGSFDTAEESLESHFARHGSEVGASSAAQYLRKAQGAR